MIFSVTKTKVGSKLKFNPILLDEKLRIDEALDLSLGYITDLKCFHRNLTGFQLQWKPLKVSKDLSGSRWALFGKRLVLMTFTTLFL